MRDDAQAGRRGFFRAVAVGGATAAAVVATTIVGKSRTPASIADATGPKQTGYRETAHIRQYYRTTQV